METSIKNKFKAFTSIEQSKKLAKILSHESADMCYNDGELRIGYAQLAIERDDYFPCWSLAALLEQLEDTAGLAKDYGLWFCYDNRKSYCTKHYDNPIDACYEMIVTLKEKGLI